MKKNGKYLLAVCIFSSALLFSLNTFEKPHNDLKTKSININSHTSELQKNENITESVPAKNNAVKISMPDTNKYILKYDKKNVILIFTDKNGIVSEKKLNEIDVKYLTKDDKKQLENGIELNNEEDVYKLIEDLSS